LFVLSDLIDCFFSARTATGVDKFDAQEYAIEVFRTFATRKNVHVTLVIHPRKEAEGVQLGVSSIFGTGMSLSALGLVWVQWMMDDGIGRASENNCEGAQKKC
jgi:twinkle protein